MMIITSFERLNSDYTDIISVIVTPTIIAILAFKRFIADFFTAVWAE